MHSFLKYNLLTEEEKNDEKEERHIKHAVRHLGWEDIFDLYGPDQAIELETDEDTGINESVLDEAISMRLRLARSLAMKRNAYRLSLSRKIKLRRMSDTEGLQKRAGLAAKRAMYKRFLGGRSKSDLSPQERAMMEDRIAKRKSFMGNLTLRMMPKVRAIERSRLLHTPK